MDLAKLHQLGQTFAASEQGVRRFHRRPAKSTRTRLVRLFKKGDRPLCPLKIRFGRLRGCGLGTEWSVPFFEPGMSLVPENRKAESGGSLLCLLFRLRGFAWAARIS
jgi:hypothetical protein